MKFLNLFFLFLFPNMAVSNSSSCGELEKIVKDLPGNCGGNSFQLECKGNNPILYFGSTMFLVKDVSFQNTTFRLVDPSYYTGDLCPLPNQTLSDVMTVYFYFNNELAIPIYFVNCTQEIEDSEYKLIPCLNSTNSRVYAWASRHFSFGFDYAWPLRGSFSGAPESYMHDSCRLVGRAIADVSFKHVNNASIMQAIEHGILVNWTAPTSNINMYLQCSVLRRCWRGIPWEYKYADIASIFLALIFWEPFFLLCLYQSSLVAFSLMLVFFVLLDIFLIILVVRILLFPLAVCSYLLHKHWKVSSSISSIERFLRKNEILRIRRYDFIEISIMTNNFREKLGQGGFGSVYRGKLLSGQQIAVKILSNSVGDGDDFISEVATIGRIHHTNIVRLIGFCSEGSKRALMYAYMPNGSLDKYIFSSSTNALSMEKRREIAIGIARGIDYLHRGCEMQILHFDIKPHNILLDHDLTPKISDFGLARLYPKDYNLVMLSMVRGTIGYIAPELISRTFGAVSYKADVYSFGMLLMEMASGRRNVNNNAESSSQIYYPSWIYDQLNLPDAAYNLSNRVRNFEEIEEKLYKVALYCIQMNASNRPTMSKVIEMLQRDADSLEMPPRPFMACSPQEFFDRSSEIESYGIELSSISEKK